MSVCLQLGNGGSIAEYITTDIFMYYQFNAKDAISRILEILFLIFCLQLPLFHILSF